LVTNLEKTQMMSEIGMVRQEVDRTVEMGKEQVRDFDP
jgi:hypothetical protein